MFLKIIEINILLHSLLTCCYSNYTVCPSCTFVWGCTEWTCSVLLLIKMIIDVLRVKSPHVLSSCSPFSYFPGFIHIFNHPSLTPLPQSGMTTNNRHGNTSPLPSFPRSSLSISFVSCFVNNNNNNVTLIVVCLLDSPSFLHLCYVSLRTRQLIDACNNCVSSKINKRMCEGFLELSKLTLTGKIMFQCTDKRNAAVYLIMYNVLIHSQLMVRDCRLIHTVDDNDFTVFDAQ